MCGGYGRSLLSGVAPVKIVRLALPALLALAATPVLAQDAPALMIACGLALRSFD